MNCKSIYWLSIFSLSLSTITIILFFVKVDENSVVNSETFISSCTAIITIAVTIAVGFQVFQSIDIKSKINEIENIKFELYNARKEFECLTADLKSSMLYNESDRKWNEGDIFNAILKLQEAIDIYLRSDLNKDLVMDWLALLEIYASAIEKREPNENEQLDKILIASFKLQWDNNTIQLQKNPNFWAISKNYKKIKDIVKNNLEVLNND